MDAATTSRTAPDADGGRADEIVTWDRQGAARMQAVRDARATSRAWQDRVLASVEVRPGIADPAKWRLDVRRGTIPARDMAALLRLAARRLDAGQDR